MKNFSALWGDYIDAKFDYLYAQHLQPFRLQEDEKNKRQKLKKMDGYMAAYKAFRQGKEAFIRRLVTMMKETASVLVIDSEASKFIAGHQ